MFSFICVWINGWVHNRKAGDLRRYHAHCDVTVMTAGCVTTSLFQPTPLTLPILEPCQIFRRMSCIFNLFCPLKFRGTHAPAKNTNASIENFSAGANHDQNQVKIVTLFTIRTQEFPFYSTNRYGKTRVHPLSWNLIVFLSPWRWNLRPQLMIHAVYYQERSSRGGHLDAKDSAELIITNDELFSGPFYWNGLRNYTHYKM